MNKTIVKSIYEKMPEQVKVLLAKPIRNKLIKNPVFIKQYEELVKTDDLSESDIKKLQLQRLKELCVFAYKNSPYYHRIFDAVGFQPTLLSSFEEYTSKVPILTKEEVLENIDDIKCTVPEGTYDSITGGSSGKRLVVTNSMDCLYRENAFIYNHYRKFGGGYDLKKSKMAYIGGYGEGGILVSNSPLYNMRQYNSMKINQSTIQAVVDDMNQYKPDFIRGLPSAIFFFCKLVNQSNLELKFKCKGVIFQSENLYNDQILYIEKTLKANSLTHYGSTERVIFAEQISPSKRYNGHPVYKFNDSYGFTEVSKDGLLIGTGFINRGMPLLRYKTDDVAKMVGDGLWTIYGHRVDVLYGKNGERVSLASFTDTSIVFEKIWRYQFVQDKPGIVLVNIVPIKKLSETDMKKVQNFLNDKAQGTIEFELRILDEIELTARGKFKLLIQNIKE